MVEPVSTTVVIVKGFCWLCTTLGIGYCAKQAHDAYSKHSKRHKERLVLKGKSLEEAREDNRRAREEEKKAREALEEQESKNKEIEKELEEAKRKANDNSLPEEERAKWRRKIAVLEEQLSNGRGESKSLTDTLKRLTERIKNNSKIISGIGTNTDEKHWIWDFLTLENILIMLAIYALWQIARDEKKKN